MAYENPGPSLSFASSTGIAQYTLVQLSTAKVLQRCAAAGQNFLGVLTSSGTTGSTQDNTVQTVQIYGVTKARVSTASTGIDAGVLVTSSTVGTITPTSAGDYAVGRALESVTSTATLVPFLIQPVGTT